MCPFNRAVADGSPQLSEARLTSTINLFSLFVYDLDLLVDYLAGKPVNRNVHPVMLFAFDEEACKSGSAGWIAAALRDHINQQDPCARLGCVRKRGHDQLASLFVAA